MKARHEHDFKPFEKVVLLADYKSEDGEMKYQQTVGKDILKGFKCADPNCGQTSMNDLERVLL